MLFVLHYAGNLPKDELECDVLKYYGIVKNIEIIGEAVRMLTEDFKANHPDGSAQTSVAIDHKFFVSNRL